MKRHELTTDYLVDLWLKKYHNTTLEEVKKNHPEWVKDEDAMQQNTRTFYETYQVTNEQHDEWYNEAIEIISKVYGISKKTAKKNFAFAYLNCAPMIRK